VFNVLIFVQST
jgi:hypothetical protein